MSNHIPAPHTAPLYKRVPGGTSWADAMFRQGADSFTYAARLTQNLDRFHFKQSGDLTATINSDASQITLYCRGIHITTLTQEDIEILRATAATAFEDHVIEKLRNFNIPEAFKMKLFREKDQSEK